MHEKIAFKNNHQEQLKHLPTTEKAGKGKRSLKSVRKKKKSKNYIKLQLPFYSSHQHEAYISFRQNIIVLLLL